MHNNNKDKTKTIACKYFIKGQCKFGNNCKFNHNLINCFLIRHAESIYNQILSSFSDQSQTNQAKEKFQMDKLLMDCGLTQNGLTQIDKVKFPSEKGQKAVKFDIVFVSPLQRCLKTLEILINKKKIKEIKVIILPGLTQVVSKICDLGHSIQHKKNKYQNFNFSYMSQHPNQWQDNFIDDQVKDKINEKQRFGNRYLEILNQIFPKPLENSYRCFDRTLKTIDQIKEICKNQNAKKILVVSHNRIIKYIMGRNNKGRSESIENCQIKFTLL